MSIADEVADIISNLSSEDQETRKSARTALLTHSRTKSGVTALLNRWIVNLQDLIDGGERDSVAICMSRILRYKATKGLDDWNLGRLEDSRIEFERTTKEEKQKDLLQAVWYFALAYPGEASLIEAAGWVQATLRCKQKLYGPAVLLLDALDSLATLPGVMHAARQTGLMLAHVFAKGEKRERGAGGRVALRVLGHLEQGEADGIIEPGAADAWRTMLKNKNIVQAVVGCIDSSATDAAVERSLDLLAQLSMHEVFLKIVRTEEVLRVLVNDVVGEERLGTSLFAILRQVLTSRKAANVFASIGGVGVCLNVLDNAGLEDAVVREMISVLSLWLRHATRQGAVDAFTSNHGLRICLDLLDEDDPDAARSILALLKAWSDKATVTQSAFDELPDLSLLLSFLSSQDMALAEPARVLVSWALHHQGDRAELATGLEDDAIGSLLPFLATSPQDARYAVGALACLIKARVRGEEDEESAGKFAEFGVHHRLLEAASDPASDEMLGAGVDGLAPLAMYGTDIADDLVSTGAIGVLLAQLGAEKVTAGGYDKNTHIMATVLAILETAGEAEKVDTSAIQTLLQVMALPGLLPAGSPKEVSRTWSPSQSWLAFTAIVELTRGDLDNVTDLEDALKKGCVQLTVTMLREKPHAVAATEALAFLSTILCEASASVGQTFIDAGGPELLVRHVKLEDDDRDGALEAVLSIACNENLHNVMADLVKHAGTALAVLCNTFPPFTPEAAMQLRPLFEEAFGDLPEWPATEGTSTETGS